MRIEVIKPAGDAAQSGPPDQRQTPHTSPRLLYPIAFVAFVLFAAFNVWAIGALYESFEAYSWPHAKGVIISSVARSKIMQGRRGEYIVHWPDVRYYYNVHGKNYFNDRVRFMHRGMSKGETQEVVSTYPVNKVVDVYYNPDNPAASTLEVGVYWLTFPVLIFSFILMFLMPAIVVNDYKRRRQRSQVPQGAMASGAPGA